MQLELLFIFSPGALVFQRDMILNILLIIDFQSGFCNPPDRDECRYLDHYSNMTESPAASAEENDEDKAVVSKERFMCLHNKSMSVDLRDWRKYGKRVRTNITVRVEFECQSVPCYSFGKIQQLAGTTNRQPFIVH